MGNGSILNVFPYIQTNGYQLIYEIARYHWLFEKSNIEPTHQPTE